MVFGVAGAAVFRIAFVHRRVGLEGRQRGSEVLLCLVKPRQTVADLHRFSLHLLGLGFDLLVDLVRIAAEDALHRSAHRLAGELGAFLAGGDARIGDAAQLAVIGDQQRPLRIAHFHLLAADDEVALCRNFSLWMTGRVQGEVLAPQRTRDGDAVPFPGLGCLVLARAGGQQHEGQRKSERCESGHGLSWNFSDVSGYRWCR